MDFETIREEVQADLGGVDGVIPVGDGVHHRLEHSVHGELGCLDAAGRLNGEHPHIAFHEAAGPGDLNIQRTGDILRIELVRPAASGSPITDGLDKGVGDG